MYQIENSDSALMDFSANPMYLTMYRIPLDDKKKILVGILNNPDGRTLRNKCRLGMSTSYGVYLVTLDPSLRTEAAENKRNVWGPRHCQPVFPD